MVEKYVVKYFDTQKCLPVKLEFVNASNALRIAQWASKQGFITTLIDSSSIL